MRRHGAKSVGLGCRHGPCARGRRGGPGARSCWCWAWSIYLNRDEDAIAVDNLLAENITREIGTAEQRGADVDLADVTDFEWDHVLVAERKREPRRDLAGARRAVEGRASRSAPATS